MMTSIALLAVTGSVVAGLIHISLGGVFFLAAAAVQVVLPLVAMARGGLWWRAVAAANVVAIGAYVAAVLGVAPIQHDGAEAVSVLGVATVLLELVAVLGSVQSGSASLAVRVRSWSLLSMTAMVLAGVVAIGLAPSHELSESASSSSLVTPEQQAKADALVAATTQALMPYADVSAAEAAGYEWIGDGRRPGSYRHYVNPELVQDPVILNPTQIESLVYQSTVDGGMTLVSGMYVLPPGQTMDDVPDIAGDLTMWHEHSGLCWTPQDRLAGAGRDGQCPTGSTARSTPPMLHVWVVDNPDGPFAGIDGH